MVFGEDCGICPGPSRQFTAFCHLRWPPNCAGCTGTLSHQLICGPSAARLVASSCMRLASCLPQPQAARSAIRCRCALAPGSKTACMSRHARCAPPFYEHVGGQLIASPCATHLVVFVCLWTLGYSLLVARPVFINHRLKKMFVTIDVAMQSVLSLCFETHDGLREGLWRLLVAQSPFSRLALPHAILCYLWFSPH